MENRLANNTSIATALALAILAVAGVVPIASAQAAGTEVQIDQFTFAPQQVTVKAGMTVTWINDDDAPHSVASSTKLSIQRTVSPSRSRRPVLMIISVLCTHT
jgi:plastocyanin